MPTMKIEWSSDFHSDGRRRSRPKASTIHGWIVKWRGTFLGNETTRREGIREMREAKAIRQRRRENMRLARSTSSASVPPRSQPRPTPVRRNTTGGSGSKGSTTRGTVRRANTSSRTNTSSRPNPPVRRATAPTGFTRKPPVRTNSTPAHGSRTPVPRRKPSQQPHRPRPSKRTT